VGGADLGGELLSLFAQRAKITLDLQAVPELGCLAEKRRFFSSWKSGSGSRSTKDWIMREAARQRKSGKVPRPRPTR